MDVKQFVCEVDDDLLCSICHSVMLNPHSCNQGHAFCYDCIARWMQSSTTCPVGRCQISQTSLTKLLVVQNMISKMTVRCPNSAEMAPDHHATSVRRDSTAQSTSSSRSSLPACEWQGKLCEQQGHLKECGFSYVECSHPNCNIRVHRARLSDHETHCSYRLLPCEHCNKLVRALDMAQHFDVCASVLIDCPLACGEPVPRGNLPAHQQLCPNASVDCPFAVHGCRALLQRRHLAQHQIDAAAQHSELVSSRVTDLGLQLSALTERLQETEAARKRRVVWRVEGVSSKLSARQNLASKVFSVATATGEYRLKLWLEFNGEHIGLFVMHHHDEDDATATGPLPITIGGSSVTVEGVTAPSETNLYAAGDVILEAGQGLGRAQFLAVSRVVSGFVAGDDAMVVRAAVCVSCIAELAV